MAQYVYSMRGVNKVVPPKRVIIKDISLSFFPGAKIGVLGVNGSGKSSLLKIMAGVDTDFDGDAEPMPNLNVGFLPQEPQLDPDKTVRETVEEGLGDIAAAKKKLDEIYAAYAEPDADFDKLAAEQAKYEAIVNGGGGDIEHVAAVVAFPGMDLVHPVDGFHAERRHLRIAMGTISHGLAPYRSNATLQNFGSDAGEPFKPWLIVLPRLPRIAQGAAVQSRLRGAAMSWIKPAPLANCRGFTRVSPMPQCEILRGDDMRVQPILFPLRWLSS